MKSKFEGSHGIFSSSMVDARRSVHLFVDRINGVFCLRFKWCLCFLWQIWRQVRLMIIANAPIVIQMPKTMGNCTYQLSSSFIGLVDDAFALSIKSVLKSESVLGSVLHVGGCVVVTNATVLILSSADDCMQTKQKNNYFQF